MSAPASSLHMSNSGFWLYTIGLLVVWVVVLCYGSPIDDNITQSVVDKPRLSPAVSVKSSQELLYAENCKALCGNCGCRGFYCGEECICECNDEKADTECIAIMQKNARSLKIPFELLIQGPSKNRFVRNALQFEQNAERKKTLSASISREKRSTVVVYKPDAQNTLDNVHKEVQLDDDNTSTNSRPKRSVNHLEWFSDLANNLVRPAPLVQAKNAEEAPAVAANQKRGTAELDRSWFSDSANGLIRPAPLFKRNGATAGNENPYDLPMKAIERLPQVVRDTLRNIQEGAFVENFPSTFMQRPRDNSMSAYSNALPSPDMVGANIRNGFDEVIDSMRSQIWSGYNLGSTAPPTVMPVESRNFNMPWIRPVRFLKRVQEIIKKDK